MTLVVEDGTGLDSAESYDTIENIAAYAVKVGKAFPITGSDGPATAAAIAAAEAAARRATAALDAKYGATFLGSPSHVEQALEWPRSGVTYRGEEMTDDWIPKRLKDALAEAAIRELATPGSLSPDLKRGGAIKSVGAGSARVEFMDGAPVETTFSAIDGLLSALVGPKKSTALFGYLLRA